MKHACDKWRLRVRQASMPGVYKETDENKSVDFVLFCGYTYLVRVTGIQRDTSFSDSIRCQKAVDFLGETLVKGLTMVGK